jgi:hypothetical protein
MTNHNRPDCISKLPEVCTVTFRTQRHPLGQNFDLPVDPRLMKILAPEHKHARTFQQYCVQLAASTELPNQNMAAICHAH